MYVSCFVCVKKPLIGMWERFKLNRRIILKKAGAWTASVYAVLGFLAAFVSLEEILTSLGIIEMWRKVLVSALVLLVVFLICLIISSFRVLHNKKVKVLTSANGYSLYVIYGDLFSFVPDADKRRNVCFAVNRCFDTIVDNKLLSAETVHGKAFKELYNTGVFTPDSLNDAIQDAVTHGAKYEMLTAEEKPSGNLKRYEVGTGADLAVSDNLHYFLIGLGKMDVNLRNSAENAEYCMAIQKMIEFCDTYSQGYPVLMPIVGAGRTRLGQDPKELLKYLIQSFAINSKRLSSDVYIVLRESDKENISIADLNG